jgi:hypothetical protein
MVIAEFDLPDVAAGGVNLPRFGLRVTALITSPQASKNTQPRQAVPTRVLLENWDVCLTVNGSWGYNPRDPFYK